MCCCVKRKKERKKEIYYTVFSVNRLLEHRYSYSYPLEGCSVSASQYRQSFGTSKICVHVKCFSAREYKPSLSSISGESGWLRVAECCVWTRTVLRRMLSDRVYCHDTRNEIF